MGDPARHRRVVELFLECSELDEADAEARLAALSGDDRDLVDDVRAMLAFEARDTSFLDQLPESATPHAAGLGADLDSDRPLPDAIGPYRVRRLLGQGGMGVVYEAEQELPRRTVALKLLHPGLTSENVLRRFEREGEILGRLQHPGIARVYATGQVDTEAGRQPFLAMELIEGEPLTTWAQRSDATTEQRLALFADICDAVQHAHNQGVIHRDLKPANILVDAAGQPHILDFGIARVVDGDVQLTLQTHIGEIIGTLAYMSPEQALGDPTAIDSRSDVYSLGVLLYELLADELPYDVSSQSLPRAIEAVREAEPRRLSTIRRTFRGDVETIVLAALEKEPARRYPTAAALAADLRHVLAHEPIQAHPPSRIYQVRKFVRRHRVLVGSGAAVVLALAAGLAAALHFGFQEAAQRELADRQTATARVQAYQATMLAAQLTHAEGNLKVAAGQLESAPEALRDWEWDVLSRMIQREIATLDVPDVWIAEHYDEERVVFVREAGGTHLWDTVTGDVTPLPGPEARPLTFSEDARRLLSWDDGVLLVTAVPGGELLAEVPLDVPIDGQPIHSWCTSALSADGSQLAVATDENVVLLVDLGPEPRVQRLLQSDTLIKRLAFSPDGDRLAVGMNSAFGFWDTRAPRKLWQRTNGTGKFDSVAFDPAQGEVWISTKLDIMRLDAGTGEVLETWTGAELGTMRLGAAFDLQLDTHSDVLVALFRSGNAFLLDSTSGDRLGQIAHSGHKSVNVLLSPERRTLLTCGRDLMQVGVRSLTLWEASIEATDVLVGHTSTIESVVVAPGGEFAASSSWDRTTRLWDPRTGALIRTLGNRNRVFCSAISPDGRRLVCGLLKSGFEAWDLETGEKVYDARSEPRGCSVRYAPDGSVLAMGHAGGDVSLLDPQTYQIEHSWTAADERVVSLAWSPDSGLLATGAENGELALWDASTNARVAHWKGSGRGAREQQGVRSLAFSPDGRQLLSGWGSREVLLHRVPDLEPVRDFDGHQEEVFAVAWSPSGRRIVSGGRDGLLRVWNPETGGLLVALPGHDSYIRSLAFTPDGRTVVTASGDATVRLWDSHPAGERWRERGLLGRQAAGVLASDR